MPDIQVKGECTALQQNGPGNFVSNQQSALPAGSISLNYHVVFQKQCGVRNHCNRGDLNVAAEMALQLHDMIITTARTVENEVVHIEENESMDRLHIHTVSHIQYLAKDPEGH
jgi:hypothetical protein